MSGVSSNESRERIQFICEIIHDFLVHVKLGFVFPIQSHGYAITVERRSSVGLDMSISALITLRSQTDTTETLPMTDALIRSCAVDRGASAMIVFTSYFIAALNLFSAKRVAASHFPRFQTGHEPTGALC